MRAGEASCAPEGILAGQLEGHLTAVHRVCCAIRQCNAHSLRQKQPSYCGHKQSCTASGEQALLAVLSFSRLGQNSAGQPRRGHRVVWQKAGFRKGERAEGGA